MTIDDPLIFVGTSDLSGIIRGKSFPASELEKRSHRGVGWTPTNVQITCFDNIADSPFGALGDLALIPDPETHIALSDPSDTVPPRGFMLGDIKSLEGVPWAFCTRSLAKRALDALHDVSGASLMSAFEHEFQIKHAPIRNGDAFGFKGFRDAQDWAEALLAALAKTRCVPDTFMKEYGPSQYEITNKPALGIVSPDNAAILRLLTHDVLAGFGVAPSFSPILDPKSVGNGVHIHFSFIDDQGTPLGYDAADPYGMSPLTRHFIGGILQYLDQILALLASSEISYLRLSPHRWSAAFNNLGYRDREASVRICPISASDPHDIARQFNFEVRAVDATSSPYLAFAAIVFAGVQGIKDQIAPPEPTQEDLCEIAPEDLARRGFKRLPQTLAEALACLERSAMVRSWFGDAFVDLFLAHKRGEMAQLEGLDWAQKCDRYKDVY